MDGITPALRGADYWALVNPRALPRAFVPARVETIADRAERLRRLGAADFDPRAVAFAREPVTLPASCRGEVVIAEEIPRRVRLNIDMATPGLVVLADLWDKGWAAYLDGKRVPVLRVDHALRGVVVPAGKGALEFRHELARFRLGLELAGLGRMDRRLGSIGRVNLRPGRARRGPDRCGISRCAWDQP